MTRGVRSFKRWMKSNGIEYSDALDLCIGQGNSVAGIGVRALCDLKEGDLIATIPKKACLTITNTAASYFIQKAGLGGVLGLAVALMYERSKGPSSPWYAYLQLLPYQECVPLVWSVDEVDTLLAGTELHKVVNEDMQFLREDWEESIAPLTVSYPSEFRRDWFSVEQYFAAKTLVESRAFEVDDYFGFGMVPLADLFNHKTAAEDVHFTSESNVDDSDIDTPEASLVDEEHNGDSPNEISDFAISKERDDASLYSGLNENGIDDIQDTFLSSNLGSNNEVLEMILVKDVKAENEVFNTYGTLSNAALLHRYGFTEPDNPFDIINIDFDLVIDCCLLLFSRRHLRVRVALWRRLGCAGCSSQDCEYFEVSANGTPQLELLLLLYIIHLPDEVYQRLDCASPQHCQSITDVKKFVYFASQGFEVVPSLHKNKKRGPNYCIETNENKLRKSGCNKKLKIGEDGDAFKSDEWLLTSSVCQCLILLADKRDRLYGSSSLKRDLEFLKTCVSTEHPKLFNAMSLRVSERSILQSLRLYALKAKSANKVNCNSYRK
ncbi:hypothetical protein SUGI_0293720 [Cryptomeria japonica]|uniref:ribosomal lysine N-methyltransferase 3 n=1 Tax=Cryptomeria japonica TaxID=3369 RepID=UPI002408D82C|nr:ribosomal lysine N-methyltransferase 3 [Cryptomeria japonica]GLJ16984.1 hypothetical protein SUGI_0293720 [Cryptomeria japonica]